MDLIGNMCKPRKNTSYGVFGKPISRSKIRQFRNFAFLEARKSVKSKDAIEKLAKRLQFGEFLYKTFQVYDLLKLHIYYIPVT